MQKRLYQSPKAFARDIARLVRDLRRLRSLQGSRVVDGAFRERLMLTVTEVNGCRYCAYAHAKMALKAGLQQADIDSLTQGDLQDVPTEQVIAVLYAQHWAESDGEPDAEARQRVLDTYGPDKTEAIEIYMRMMRVGNLAGNSWACLLGKVSFGRMGDAGS